MLFYCIQQYKTNNDIAFLKHHKKQYITNFYETVYTE